jgi:hypothetical protein
MNWKEHVPTETVVLKLKHSPGTWLHAEETERESSVKMATLRAETWNPTGLLPIRPLRVVKILFNDTQHSILIRQPVGTSVKHKGCCVLVARKYLGGCDGN